MKKYTSPAFSIVASRALTTRDSWGALRGGMGDKCL